MRIKEFVDTELKSYSVCDNKRSIPELMDGLKTTQRRLVYCMMKHPKRAKVSVIGPKASQMTNYPHGETSIMGAAVNMAQDFVGSNNLPLLNGIGMFGTILDKESSSFRYIHAELNTKNSKIFNPNDDIVLQYKEKEGHQIEPKTYYPMFPLAFVNGCKGIGNGYSINLLPHDIKDLKKCAREYVRTGYIKTKLVPHFNGYKGKVERDGEQIIITGVIEKVNSTTLRITELPPKHEISKYKKLLFKLVDDKFIKGFKNNSTKDGWNIEIKATRETVKLDESVLLDKFKMIDRMTQTVVFWNEGVLTQFKTPEHALETFFKHRLDIYHSRNKKMISRLKSELNMMCHKINFINLWNEESVTMRKFDKQSLIRYVTDEIDCSFEEAEPLIKMPVYNLTESEIDKCRGKMRECENNIQELLDQDVNKQYLKEINF